MTEQVQWQKLNWTESDRPQATNPFQSVSSSIWIAHTKGKHAGIVEYYPESGTTSPTIPYPAHFNKVDEIGSVVCYKYKEDSIILIDHEKRRSIVFDTKTHKYSVISPFSGRITQSHCSSCITVGDYIHIFDGIGMRDEYTICSIKDSKSRSEFPEQRPQHYAVLVPVMKTNGSYKSSNKMLISGFIRKQGKNRIPSVICDIISKFCRFELIKFGGERKYVNRRRESWEELDSFYIGTLKDDDAAKPIEWELAPEYTLKYPLSQFGYVQHGAFLVIFGGETDKFENKGASFRTRYFFRDIFVLDLSKKTGWVQSPVKCPSKGIFHAVLDRDLQVHLMSQRTFFDRERQKYKQEHYCMKFKDIIPQSMYKGDEL